MPDTKRYRDKQGTIFQVKNVLASIEFLVIEMTDYFFTSSDFTQKVPFSYLPEFPMTFLLPFLPFLGFFLLEENLIVNSLILYK